MRRTWRLPGGIHPPERKQSSLQTPIRAADIPPRLWLPLNQHSGVPATPVAAVGDTVLKGQLIATANGNFSAAVHASSSGVVAAIEDHPVPHPSGMTAPCIVIDTDGEDRWISHQGLSAAARQDPTQIIDRAHKAGVAGLGGAGFPTAIKLSPRPEQQIDTLIINGTECEPYITADDMLMRERGAQVIDGIRLLATVLTPKEILIGIEDNKPEAIAAMRAAAGTECEVVSFPTRYPSGGEKQLIQILTGREVPSGALPADIGIVCQNVGTAYAVHRAVDDGEPLISRITTLTGDALERAGNVEVLLGTPIGFLLEQAGFDPGRASRLIMGGPMMGFSLESTAVPVIKTTNCLLAPTVQEMPSPPPAQACIRCGLCAEACPASLLPQQLYWYAQAKDHPQLEDHRLFDCIECGACAWVCPSNIPLVQYYRASKADVRQQHEDHRRAELSRQRFETRQARIEQEQAEKEARRRERAARAAKSAGAGGDGQADEQRAAMVKAAVERVKAKKTAGDSATVKQLRVAIDSAAEKTVVRQQADLAPLDTSDPAAAAIARAQARRTQAADDVDSNAVLQKTIDSTRRKIARALEKLEAAGATGDSATIDILETALAKQQQKLAEAETRLAGQQSMAGED